MKKRSEIGEMFYTNYTGRYDDINTKVFFLNFLTYALQTTLVSHLHC
jgi:hypothetical protein